MKRLYLAGPFKGPTNLVMQRNIDRAARVAHKLWSMGAAVFCPHLNSPLAWQGSLSDETWLEGDKAWILVSDVMVLMPNWQASEGTKAEVQLARELSIPVFVWDYYLGDAMDEPGGPLLSEWLNIHGPNR